MVEMRARVGVKRSTGVRVVGDSLVVTNVCGCVSTQEGTAIFLDGLPAPGEFVSSQLVGCSLFVVSLFVIVFVIFIHHTRYVMKM